MAIAFHEVWKPAAYDTDLHARMGVSYATQAFNITRTALRNVSTTLIQPGSEFKLGSAASIEGILCWRDDLPVVLALAD